MALSLTFKCLSHQGVLVLQVDLPAPVEALATSRPLRTLHRVDPAQPRQYSHWVKLELLSTFTAGAGADNDSLDDLQPAYHRWRATPRSDSPARPSQEYLHRAP